MIDKINSNVTFNGGFRFKNIPAEAKEQLPSYFLKHRQIFDNFEKQGDVFLTVRRGTDRKVYQFIKDNNLKFEYYSKIDTRSGLDNERHEELTELIKNCGEKPIKSLEELEKKLFKPKKVKIEYTPAEEGAIKNILKSLCMDLDKKPMSIKKNITVINDKEFARKVFISPQSEYGVHYVMVKPNSPNQTVERYAISPDGQIVSKYSTPEGIKRFDKQIKSLMTK